MFKKISNWFNGLSNHDRVALAIIGVLIIITISGLGAIIFRDSTLTVAEKQERAAMTEQLRTLQRGDLVILKRNHQIAVVAWNGNSTIGIVEYIMGKDVEYSKTLHASAFKQVIRQNDPKFAEAALRFLKQ